jgi:hypothetical protein
MRQSGPVVGIAWFRPEQWERLLEVSDDRDKLEPTHAAWEKFATQTLKRLRRSGVNARKVDVDVEEILAWCAEHGHPMNASARAEFVSRKVLAATKGG